VLQRELHTAVRQRNPSKAQQLLDAGARADQRSFSSTDLSETPLLTALINGDTAMAHVLLEAPSTDVNSLNSCVHTPLQYSTLAANWPMVQTLLTHGANPSVSTDTAPVPLALATSTDIIVELLQHRATVDPLTGEQVTNIICKVLQAPADQLHLTRVQRKELLLSAAGWQWSLGNALRDENLRGL
jgi:ankyrin repeat protein